MAASLLLKLMMSLGDVQEVETRPPGRGFNDGQRPNCAADREAKG
jgi:hypothetical protein